MKILCYDPPYSGLSAYVQGEKSSGLNRDLSRQDDSCLELMSSFFGTRNKEKARFRRIEVAARLISDDISVIEPDEYVPTDNPAVETCILGAMHALSTALRETSLEDHIAFFSSASIRRALIDQALSKSALRELWDGLPDHDKEAAIAQIAHALTAYYPPLAQEGDDDALFLTSDPYFNRAHAMNIGAGGLGAANVLTILAISGIEIALPGIYSDEPDVIAEIKEKFRPERDEYITYLRGFLKDCHLAVKAGNYKDAWDFAAYNSTNDLLIKLHKFEAAVAGSDSKLLSAAASNLAEKGVAVAQSVLDGKFVRAGWEIIAALVTSLKGGTERTKARSEYLMVSYAFKVKESLGRTVQ